MYRLLIVGVFAGCGSDAPPPQPPAAPAHPTLTKNGERIVAPSLLEGLRIAGDKSIPPPDDVKAQMSSPGPIKASFKLCLADTGEPSDVVMLRSSGFPTWDEKIARELHTWKYRPYQHDGQPLAVCTAITFVFSQRR
jgi:hypothetical protein